MSHGDNPLAGSALKRLATRDVPKRAPCRRHGVLFPAQPEPGLRWNVAPHGVVSNATRGNGRGTPSWCLALARLRRTGYSPEPAQPYQSHRPIEGQATSVNVWVAPWVISRAVRPRRDRWSLPTVYIGPARPIPQIMAAGSQSVLRNAQTALGMTTWAVPHHAWVRFTRPMPQAPFRGGPCHRRQARSPLPTRLHP